MKIISSIEEILLVSHQYRVLEKIIGFVPTMGALHDGHLSLIKNAKESCDITVCSIFVNKEQFNNNADFDNYPIQKKEDIEKLKQSGCDILFYPNSNEIYKEKPLIKFNFGHLENTMEGAFRPGHFSGVALIVSKLFHYVNPHKAFFGQKDFQQLAVIKRLVSDLSFDVEVVACPTSRDENGLALSSRNLLLTQEERNEATKIYQGLKKAEEWLREKEIDIVKYDMVSFFNNTNLQLEYFEIVDSNTLELLKKYTKDKPATLCIAAYLGNVRLIDNIQI